MRISERIAQLSSVFLDTAPIIYFIEGNPEFGHCAKTIMESIESGSLLSYTSVVTLLEVIVNPIRNDKQDLAVMYTEFLRDTNNLILQDITEKDAELVGKLRACYPSLKSLDSLQLAVAMNSGVDAFVTNDKKLKQIKEIDIIVLADHVQND